MPVRMTYRKYQEAQNIYLHHKGILGTVLGTDMILGILTESRREKKKPETLVNKGFPAPLPRNRCDRI